MVLTVLSYFGKYCVSLIRVTNAHEPCLILNNWYVVYQLFNNACHKLDQPSPTDITNTWHNLQQVQTLKTNQELHALPNHPHSENKSFILYPYRAGCLARHLVVGGMFELFSVNPLRWYSCLFSELFSDSSSSFT